MRTLVSFRSILPAFAVLVSGCGGNVASGASAPIPNNVVAKEAITNYSEPTAPTRLFVDVGASYLSPPNQVTGSSPVT